MRIGFTFDDLEMPRTVYFERLRAALAAHPSCTGAAPDLLFPAEDTTVETNWPRYARTDSAWLRGSFEEARHLAYLDRVAADGREVCIVSMHPLLRIPLRYAADRHVTVADINLLTWERAANPRSIAMPAMPVTAGTFEPEAKRLLAGFRGVASHPSRAALAALHDGRSIHAEIVASSNHFGRLDAEKNDVDSRYVDLLRESIFAFVPRGDVEFSYRLLEVMSFGCIPIVLSDGWVLPFDRLVPWSDISLTVPEAQMMAIPTMLSRIPPARVAEMQAGVVAAYARWFDGFDRIAEGLLAELTAMRAAAPAAAPLPGPTSAVIAAYVPAPLPAPPSAPPSAPPQRQPKSQPKSRWRRLLGG